MSNKPVSREGLLMVLDTLIHRDINEREREEAADRILALIDYDGPLTLTGLDLQIALKAEAAARCRSGEENGY